jgi:ygbB family
MGVGDDRVSVKATTTEHLGFEGREEGVSVSAVALIYKMQAKPGEETVG